VSILLTFFLAMLMNPAAQDQAQEEIDRVIGTDRLPTFDDEPKLPFVSALSKEVFRWQQVAPFGTRPQSLCAGSYLYHAPAIPHRLMEDDIYNGYFLPKNSIVLGNAWYVSAALPLRPTADDEIASGRSCTTTGSFPDPFTFKPERFTDPTSTHASQPQSTMRSASEGVSAPDAGWPTPSSSS
jgi:hypothetical protein